MRCVCTVAQPTRPRRVRPRPRRRRRRPPDRSFAHTHSCSLTNTCTQSQFPVKVLRRLEAILCNALVIIIVYPSSNYSIVTVLLTLLIDGAVLKGKCIVRNLHFVTVPNVQKIKGFLIYFIVLLWVYLVKNIVLLSYLLSLASLLDY